MAEDGHHVTAARFAALCDELATAAHLIREDLMCRFGAVELAD